MLRLLILCLTPALLAAAQHADSEAIGRKAVYAERNGDFAGAIAAFQELLHNGADSAELRSNLGIAYYQLHEFGHALQQFRAALAESPDSITANLFCGLSLLKLQRPKEALHYLEAAHNGQPGDIQTILALGGAEIASNDIARARGTYEEATRLDASNAEAWYGLGITDRILAEHSMREKPSEARSLLDASGQAIGRAMQLNPGSVRARMILGESFRIAERYDLAVQEYRAATEQQPNAAPAWAGLATAYSASGDDQNALKAAGRALALAPNDAATVALVAGTYMRLGDYAKAQEYAARALHLQPDLAGAELVMAKIYLAKQQPAKALPALLAAATEDTDGGTYYLLATTLTKLGRLSEARAAMRNYQRLHGVRVATLATNRGR